MAVDKKISQLASGAPAQAGDEYVVARSGANFKLTLTNIAASMPPIGATTPNTGSFTSLTNSGNLTFSSTGQRITGDFGNATLANRVYFQNSTVNGNTDIMAVPNGTGTLAQVSAWSSNDPANSSLAALRVTAATDVRVLSSIQGTGTFLPMTFYTGGSERMRLDTSGNLGLGASPSYRLDVQGGTASFTGSSGANAIRIAGAGGSWFWIDNPTTTTMRFSSGATAGTGVMVLDSSGNVGIGTASTGFNAAGLPLVVGSGSGNTGMTIFSGTAGVGSIHFGDTVTTGADGYRGFLNYNHSTNAMQLGTDATARITIDSSGNVGIGGTANATDKVSVRGTLPSNNGNSLAFINRAEVPSTSTGVYQGYTSLLYTQAASFTLTSAVHFQAQQVTIGSGSTVTNQYGFLVDSGMTGATNNYGFYSNIASGSNRWNFYAAGTARNYFAGNTGVGEDASTTFRFLASSNSASLYALGAFSRASSDSSIPAVLISKFANDSTTAQVFVQFAINNNTTGNGQINANGASAAAFGTYSDIRLKENIVDLPSQLENICALRPVEFDYKTGGHQIGFIAQEMEKVYSDVVSSNTDEMLMITGWSKTEARLVKAIQELSAKVAALEAK